MLVMAVSSGQKSIFPECYDVTLKLKAQKKKGKFQNIFFTQFEQGLLNTSLIKPLPMKSCITEGQFAVKAWQSITVFCTFFFEL